jgi:hypothetical protein
LLLQNNIIFYEISITFSFQKRCRAAGQGVFFAGCREMKESWIILLPVTGVCNKEQG